MNFSFTPGFFTLPVVITEGRVIYGAAWPSMIGEFMDNIPLFLGVPWGIFMLVIIIFAGLVIASLVDDTVAFKFIGWGFAILGTYTLIYCVFYLIRYMIGLRI